MKGASYAGAIKRFSAALRPSVRSRIEHSGNADIVIGVFFHSSAHTIIHVLRMMNRKIDRYYPDKRAVVIVPNGGSTDGTRDSARFADPKSCNVESIVTLRRRRPGKVSALRDSHMAKPWPMNLAQFAGAGDSSC